MNENYRELRKQLIRKDAPWYAATDKLLETIKTLTKEDGELRAQFIELVDYLKAQVLADAPGTSIVTPDKVRVTLAAFALSYPALEAILDIPRDRPNPNPNHQAMMRFFAAMAGDPRYIKTLDLPEPRRPVNRWAESPPRPDQTDLFG